MNKKSIFFTALAAMMLAACNNEDEVTVNDGPVAARITAGVGAPATRAIGANWNQDHIGVMVTSPSDMKELYQNVEYSTESTTTTADFTAVGKDIFFQNENEVTFAAYAPYKVPEEIGEGKIEVKTKENNTAAAQEDIDFLFASGATASKHNPTVIFTDNTGSGGSDCSFHHQMAQLNLVFKTSANDGFDADDIFNTGNVFTLGGLVHIGSFDTATGTVTATGSVESSWNISSCKYDDDKETANTRTYSLILLPQTLSSALDVSATIDGKTFSNTADVKPDLAAGYSYTYTITVKKTGLEISGCTIKNWSLSINEDKDITLQ